MKTLLSFLLVGTLAAGCTDVAPTQVSVDDPDTVVARKAPLYGTMDLEYFLGWPGPSATVPDWVGSITVDGVEYGMVFFNIGTGRPSDEAFIGNVVKFGEIWVVYEDPVEFDFETGEFHHGDVLLRGIDSGVVVLPNSTYRMNGVVEEAYGPFDEWDGRRVYMSGEILWHDFGAPHYAPGTLRLN